MIISKLQLVNFRNVDDVSVDLHPKLTVLVGDNGMGKTNILEAIHLLSFPRSFRGAKDDQLVKWGEDFTRIEGEVEAASDRSMVFFWQRKKTLQIDGQVVSNMDFVGSFLSILFAPEEVNLLSDSPAVRRAFLDAHISQLSRSYFQHLLHYSKVLKQRNRLLSRPGTTAEELVYWNDQQVLHGTAILSGRLEAIEQFNRELGDDVEMEYLSKLPQDRDILLTAFQEKQAAMISRELQAGHSLIGPHRDDWRLLELNPAKRDLGVYGSRGEQRMSVISLKKSALAIVEQLSGERAVLLLDDVLSELDAERQQYLISTLGQQQSVITTASLSDIPSSLLEDAFVYSVSQGRVEQIKPSEA